MPISGKRWPPCPGRRISVPSAAGECLAPGGFPSPDTGIWDLAACPEHGKFLIRVRLSQQPDGLTRVSRLTYEATSEAAEAYARRAEKADPEEMPRPRRRRRRSSAAKQENKGE